MFHTQNWPINICLIILITFLKLWLHQQKRGDLFSKCYLFAEKVVSEICQTVGTWFNPNFQ